MGKTYVGDVGTLIRLATKVDLSEATTKIILVRKPTQAKVQWPAEVLPPASGGIVQYAIQAGDLNEAGEYKVAASVDFSNGTHYTGETATFKVYDIFD